MKNERDPWVRVKDESELREGMAVQARPCRICRRVETIIIARRDPASYCINCVSCEGLRLAGSCNDKNSTCMSLAIRDGRLYRLADDQLAEDAEPATVVRGREMERAR